MLSVAAVACLQAKLSIGGIKLQSEPTGGPSGLCLAGHVGQVSLALSSLAIGSQVAAGSKVLSLSASLGELELSAAGLAPQAGTPAAAARAAGAALAPPPAAVVKLGGICVRGDLSHAGEQAAPPRWRSWGSNNALSCPCTSFRAAAVCDLQPVQARVHAERVQQLLAAVQAARERLAASKGDATSAAAAAATPGASEGSRQLLLERTPSPHRAHPYPELPSPAPSAGSLTSLSPSPVPGAQPPAARQLPLQPSADAQWADAASDLPRSAPSADSLAPATPTPAAAADGPLAAVQWTVQLGPAEGQVSPAVSVEVMDAAGEVEQWFTVAQLKADAGGTNGGRDSSNGGAGASTGATAPASSSSSSSSALHGTASIGQVVLRCRPAAAAAAPGAAAAPTAVPLAQAFSMDSCELQLSTQAAGREGGAEEQLLQADVAVAVGAISATPSLPQARALLLLAAQLSPPKRPKPAQPAAAPGTPGVAAAASRPKKRRKLALQLLDFSLQSFSLSYTAHVPLV